MASTVIYPPSLNSSIPAFVVTSEGVGSLNINYDISEANMIDTSSLWVHASIKRITTGQSVVIDSCGVILNLEPTLQADGTYMVTIPDTEVTTLETISGSTAYKSGWYPSWLYSVQIRLSTKKWDSAEGIGKAEWMNENSDCFSEWSTVASTKAITEPTVRLDGLELDDDGKYKLLSDTLNGKINFTSGEDETLYSYQFDILDSSDEVIESSGLLYPNQTFNKDEIKYQVKTELDSSLYYKILLTFTSSYGYEKIISYSEVYTVYSDVDDIFSSITFSTSGTEYVNSEDGRNIINVNLKLQSGKTFEGTIYIRRKSSLDNFKLAETVYSLDVNITTDTTITYEDFILESGIFYIYGVQFKKKKVSTTDTDLLSKIYYDTEYRIIDFQFSYLLGQNNQQLRLMFDNNMNSLKPNMAETKQDVIGGDYAFIFRNSNMKYKSFPLNGLISIQMDEQELFTKKEDLVQSKEIYALYQAREKNSFTSYNYERFFRDKVYNFLIDGKAKLFKSPTEGNILIRLMDISFTPNQSLGRMIYSFSATAYEIADCSIDNFTKYNII